MGGRSGEVRREKDKGGMLPSPFALLPSHFVNTLCIDVPRQCAEKFRRVFSKMFLHFNQTLLETSVPPGRFGSSRPWLQRNFVQE